jgi:hypothetical protein
MRIAPRDRRSIPAITQRRDRLDVHRPDQIPEKRKVDVAERSILDGWSSLLSERTAAPKRVHGHCVAR